jgi:hypothetical protein
MSKKASKPDVLFVALCLRTVNDLSKLILPLPLPLSCLFIHLLQHRDLLFFNYFFNLSNTHAIIGGNGAIWFVYQESL